MKALRAIQEHILNVFYERRQTAECHGLKSWPCHWKKEYIVSMLLHTHVQWYFIYSSVNGDKQVGFYIYLNVGLILGLDKNTTACINSTCQCGCK